MEVLLVNPRITYDNPYTAVGFLLPPVGLLCLASRLRQDGHEVIVHDEEIEDGRRPDWGRFGLVGVTGDTPRHGRAMAVAREAVRGGAAGRVVMGGAHATFEYEDVLRSGDVDYVVRGEGEETLAALAREIARSNGRPLPPGRLRSIEGLCFRRNDARAAIARNADRPLVPDLDGLPPPAWDRASLDRYRRTRIRGRRLVGIHTSRGCPYRCTFCSTPQLYGRTWRARGPTGILEEIEVLRRRHGFGAIAFLDDTFTVDPDRVERISDGLVDRRLDVLWWCAARVDHLCARPALIARMARAGCAWVFLGIESAAGSVLEGYRKGVTADQSLEAARLLRRHGIRLMAGFMIGGVGETRADIDRTLRLALEMDPEAAQFCLTTPYPGSALYRDEAHRIVTRDWDLYNSTRAVMRTEAFEPRDLQRELTRFYVRFYLRPRRIVRALGGSLGRYSLGIGRTYRLIRSIAAA